MPRYDYRCGECNAVEERILSIAESERVQECGCGAAMTKQPSAPAFALKGGCWAYDGYNAANKQGVKERT